MIVLPRFTLVINGTSLTAGRLSGDYVPELRQELRSYPECRGPLDVFCMGHGGWTSVDLLNDAPNVAALNPNHIFTEFGGINDCPDFGSGPAVSLATHNANNQAMVNLYRGRNPAVDITVMTMSSVSTSQTDRASLADYYAAEIATAQSMGCRVLDNYNGVSGGPAGGWPKPLLDGWTNRTAPFAITPSAGYSDLGSSAVWNAGDEVNSTISSDGLTLSATGGAFGGARCTNAISGKVHFEFTLDGNRANPTPGLGIANAAFNLATEDIGHDPNSLGWDSGSINYNGVQLVAQPAFTNTSGAIVAVEVDTSAKTIVFKQGSTTYGPFDISGISGPIYPVGQTAYSVTLKANFNQSPDGLHPLKPYVDTYLKPNVAAAVRARMAEFWAN